MKCWILVLAFNFSLFQVSNGIFGRKKCGGNGNLPQYVRPTWQCPAQPLGALSETSSSRQVNDLLSSLLDPSDAPPTEPNNYLEDIQHQPHCSNHHQHHHHQHHHRHHHQNPAHPSESEKTKPNRGPFGGFCKYFRGRSNSDPKSSKPKHKKIKCKKDKNVGKCNNPDWKWQVPTCPDDDAEFNDIEDVWC